MFKLLLLPEGKREVVVSSVVSNSAVSYEERISL